MAYKSNMQLNFRRIFCEYGYFKVFWLLRHQNFSENFTSDCHGVVFKHHLEHASRKKMVGLKHKFHS